MLSRKLEGFGLNWLKNGDVPQYMTRKHRNSKTTKASALEASTEPTVEKKMVNSTKFTLVQTDSNVKIFQ